MVEKAVYHIRVKGHISRRWGSFIGVAIEHETGGASLLTSDLLDQAGLHGVLARIRDLNLTLLSVQCIYGDPSGQPTGQSLSLDK